MKYTKLPQSPCLCFFFVFHVEQTFEAAKTLQIKIEFEMENFIRFYFIWQWHGKTKKTVTVYSVYVYTILWPRAKHYKLLS